MTYTDKQIDNRINAIKSRYKNFVELKLEKVVDGDLFLIGEDSEGEEFYLRFKSNGRLFSHREGNWGIVDNFFYNEETDQ